MIGVLTYNIPHRKTYDTLCMLKAKGYSDVVVFSKPFHYKKSFMPIYEHRPSVIFDIYPFELCKNLKFKYIEDKVSNIYLPSNSKILVCGAGIIEKDIIDNFIVINAHPGIIPNVRGLDALKWAIIEDQPIGVTSHVLGDEIDAGLIIEKKIVEITKRDTFHALAQRVYETEVLMLVEAIEKVDDACDYASPGSNILHKRMPSNIEEMLLVKFEKLKEKIK